MGKVSRNKGAAFEREVAELFRQAGIPAERCLTETRDGNVGDLTLPRDVPLVVQAKVGELPPIWKAIQEAQDAAAGSQKHPVAIVRRNIPKGSRPGTKPTDLAILPLEDFLELVTALRAHVWT